MKLRTTDKNDLENLRNCIKAGEVVQWEQAEGANLIRINRLYMWDGNSWKSSGPSERA